MPTPTCGGIESVRPNISAPFPDKAADRAQRNVHRWRVDGYLVDAVIGLSVVYKAFENMGGLQLLFKQPPNTRAAVFVFGLCHGLGLATRLQEYMVSTEGLWTNLFSFNLGVELGQLLALTLMLLVLLGWRQRSGFQSQAFALNSLLMCAGFILAGYQLTGYVFA